MIARSRTAPAVATLLLLAGACGEEPEPLVVTGTLGSEARALGRLVQARLDGRVASRTPGEREGGFVLVALGRGALEIALLDARGDVAAHLAGPTGTAARIDVCGPGLLELGAIELDPASCADALRCEEAVAEEARCREQARQTCDASADAISDCLIGSDNQCRTYLTAVIGCFGRNDPCPQLKSGLQACAEGIGCGEQAAAFLAGCEPADCPSPPAGCPASCADAPVLLRARGALAASVGCPP